MEEDAQKDLDVSCRATADTIHFFLLNDLPTAKLLEEIPFSLAHLQNAAASISWDCYLRFLNNARALLDDVSWRTLCQDYSRSPFLRALISAGGWWLFPNRFFEWGVGSGGNLLEGIFACIETRLIKVNRREGIVEYRIRSGYTDAPALFWDTLAISIQGVTQPLGMHPFSSVTWQPIDRGARFQVLFPRVAPLRFAWHLCSSIFNREWLLSRNMNQAFLEGREFWLRAEIAKRAAIEQALRESEARLKQREQLLSAYANRLQEAVQLANVGIFEHDHKQSIIYRSPEIQKIYGWPSGQSNQPYDFLEHVHADDRDAMAAEIQRSHDPAGNGLFHYTYRFMNPHGKLIWCEARATTAFESSEANKRPLRTVGAVIDITERTEYENSLNDSRRHLQAILESTCDGIFSLDQDLRYIAFNRHHRLRMHEAYGTEIEVGQSILDAITVASDRESAQANFNEAIKGRSFVVFLPFGDSSRLRSSYEISYNPMRREDGTVSGVAVFTRDIASQLQSQEALRELEEVQNLAIEATNVGIWKYSTFTQQFTIDEYIQNLLGFHSATGSAQELLTRIHPDDLARVMKQVEPLYNPGSKAPIKISHRLLLPDGKCRWITTCVTRFVKKSQSMDCSEFLLIGTIADVTDQETNALLLANSLQEKEAMLKEIHHRVKNNLQVICSLLNLQALSFQHESVQRFSIESQRRIRAMALVHETLYQSENLAQIHMPEYLHKLCNSIIQSHGNPESVQIKLSIQEIQLGLQQALPIGLIISELTNNALKHAFPQTQSNAQICIDLSTQSDLGNIRLCVRDNGVGISDTVAFDGDSAFGLNLVQLLVNQIRGTLTISNSQGTFVSIDLPNES